MLYTPYRVTFPFPRWRVTYRSPPDHFLVQTIAHLSVYNFKQGKDKNARQGYSQEPPKHGKSQPFFLF